MGLWLANPVEPRLLTLMENLFTDLGIRDRMCWIIHRQTTVDTVPEGAWHIWDKHSEQWENAVQGIFLTTKGRLPATLFGLRLRRGFEETKRYLKTQGRADDRLNYDLLLSAYTFTSRLFQRFEKGEIDGAFVWNQWGYENRALTELCRVFKKPCWYLEQGFLPKTLCFSSRGLYDEAHCGDEWRGESGSELSDSALDELLDGYKGSSVIEGATAAPEEPQPSESAAYPSVLVAGQLDDDSNIIFRAINCPTNRDLVSAACRTLGVRVLFKPHPYDKTPPPTVDTLMAAHSLESARPDVKLHQLIETCDVMVTRNSTSGIEAILYNKPVVNTGRAIYNVGSLATTVSPENVPAGIQHALQVNPPGQPTWLDEKRKFFRWLVERHLYFPDGYGHPEIFKEVARKRAKEEFMQKCSQAGG